MIEAQVAPQEFEVAPGVFAPGRPIRTWVVARRVLVGLLAAALVALLVSAVHLNGVATDMTHKNHTLTRRLTAMTARERAAEANVVRLDARVRSLNGELTSTKSELSDSQGKVATCQAAVGEAQQANTLFAQFLGADEQAFTAIADEDVVGLEAAGSQMQSISDQVTPVIAQFKASATSCAGSSADLGPAQ